jgi:carboxypeptidase PM20D1
MLKKLGLGIVVLVAGLAIVLIGNTLLQPSRQVVLSPIEVRQVDTQAVAQSLAQAISARTIASQPDPAALAQAYQELHSHLISRYPRLHGELKREVLFGASLLYTWQGADTTRKPILLMAHQDVVPVAPGTESAWAHPPFVGTIAEGFVWGRGALDDKSRLITTLEAVEFLVASGYKPQRTLMLLFGHDEEIGGQQGSARVAALFKERGVHFEFVLDEGLVITEGILAGVKAPLALIGLAEKGGLTLRLTAKGVPGHSSMPPPGAGNSAIGMLSQALHRLDTTPVPGGIRGVASAMFEAVAPEMPFAQRVALSNLWLTRPLIEPTLSKGAATNALLRTTTAITVAQAGLVPNVLPGEASAMVNFRLLPGDTAQSITEFVKRTIAGVVGTPSEPSRISSTQTPGYQRIASTIREVFPEAIVAPGLVLANTDSRHFESLADNVYRFGPHRMTSPDLARVHGNNERVSVEHLGAMVRFYERFLSEALK